MRPARAAVFVLLALAAADAAPDPSREVIDAAHAFYRASDAADVPALDRMLATDFIRAAGARFQTHQKYIDFVTAQTTRARTEIKDRAFSAETVRFFGSTAIYTGQTTATLTSPNAKPVKSELWATLVFVDSGGRWQLAHLQTMDGGLEAERAMWNKVFRTGLGFNVNPNKLLMETVQGMKPGRALDVGMGQGRNALYLASKGWQVTGVDIADEGIRIANDAAAREGLKLETVVHDIATYDWGKDKWDLVCFIYAGGRDEVSKVRESLKKGGLVVLEYFHVDGAKGSAPGGFKTGELPALYKDGFKVLRYDEVEDIADYGMQKVKLVRFVAQKT